MLFSILIPVYNVEKYIRQSLDSVLNQDEQDFEMILVDDGSTDNSGMICDEYAERYPEKIRVIHKSNEGLLLTRRRAICESKGEWFIHLDSDDYMLPGSLSAIKKVIKETRADLVLYKFVRGTETGHDIEEQIPFCNNESFSGSEKHRLIMQFLYGGSITSIWQKAARRDIVDIERDYSKWKDVSMMEDHLQSLSLLDKAGNPVFMDKAVVYYRYNETSITKKKGYSAYKSEFFSRNTVFYEEISYYAKWRLTEGDIGMVCSKHFRTQCRVIGNMILSMSSEEKKDFAEFISKLSKDEFWQEDYKRTNKQRLGILSKVCLWLIKHNKPEVLCLWYKCLSLIGGNR